MRTGFTIVELLIAIVVLTIGVLALAAAAGLVAGHVGDGGRLTNASHAARSVLDSLAGVPCARLTAGSSARGSITVRWTVTRDSLAADISATVGSELRRRSRTDAYRATVPCAP
jgi:type IV pilus assembly protein PilV